jgi:2,3-bisphosphoglycerate-independent phosphoglycerate mutase
VKAVEAVDQCLGQLYDAVADMGGVIMVTADHGNAEMMRDPATGEPHTAHTTLDVPLLLVNDEAIGSTVNLRNGRLCDLAPTILDLMGLPKPSEMTGVSLLEREATGQRDSRVA